MKNNLYSTHILMFPFLFDKGTEKMNEALIADDLWHLKCFDPGANNENYNEYIYFYEYVRKALYQTGTEQDKQVSYYFEYVVQKGTFRLDVKGKTYILNVEGISMRTFGTGIGILSIELHNDRYSDPDSILKINDFARRTYPQFLGKEGLADVKNRLLPESVALHLGEKEICEDFSYFDDMSNVSADPTYLPAFLHELMGRDRFSSLPNIDKKIYVEPIIDDRMFVISLYMNDALAEKMKAYDEENARYGYEDDSFWYEYVFVDGTGKTCQSRHMTHDLIAASTYDRWVEWGTLYGMSRYSFVALTGRRYGQDILEPHMRTMYYQIFTLLLAYRASILHFSKRVSELILYDENEEDLKQLQTKVATLYKEYINFQNNLFFREVTAQEQGIEIYRQAMEVMQIEKQIKDLDSEIAELHTYVAMKSEEERNDRLEKISELGAVFLPPSLLTGILGVSSADFDKNVTALIISLIAIFASGWLGHLMLKAKGGVKKAFLGASMGVVMFATPYCLQKASSDKNAVCSIDIQTHTKEKK